MGPSSGAATGFGVLRVVQHIKGTANATSHRRVYLSAQRAVIVAQATKKATVTETRAERQDVANRE